jgi:hypothetical protein
VSTDDDGTYEKYRSDYDGYSQGGMGGDCGAGHMTDDETDTTTEMGGRAHLAWCVERAMEYANRGDMPHAWASFASDVNKHDGTRYIGTHDFLGMAMFSGLYDHPEEFRKFISGWAVQS